MTALATSSPTRDQIASLYHLPLLDLIGRASEVHRQHHAPGEIQVCVLLSVKTGGCPEDCSYCPQSAHHEAHVDVHPLLSVEQVLDTARQARASGATRLCMGAAWRQVSDGPPFDRILEMIRRVKSEVGLLEVCCTLGMLTQGQADRLKAAGLDSYNHNLDTSPEYYNQIITTRTYQERIDTLERVRQAGISICCGGIIGMGEGDDDRVSMLHTLASLPEPPASIPINALVAVNGTPLGGRPQVLIWEMVRMIATARILFPRSMVRLSAGRIHMSEQEQALCFLAGANSIFAGEKLLTTANNEPDSDSRLFERLGLTPDPPSRPDPDATKNMGMADEAVWITGIGLITGLGADRETTWSRVRRGQSALRPLTGPGLDDHQGAPSPLPRDEAVDPWEALAAAATTEALADAGLLLQDQDLIDPDRAAVLLSLSKGGVHALSRLAGPFHDDPPAVGRDWTRQAWPSAAASLAQELSGFRGPCLAPVAACASGLVAAIQGADLIQRGVCDLALVGAVDASLHPLVLEAFRRMKVLARVPAGSDPAQAVRPWDRRRDGFLVGEGAAVLILERAGFARHRGVLPYVAFAAGALGSSAHHLTDLGDDPSSLARVIRQTMDRARCPDEALDLVHLHGTATRQNDRHETQALRLALPERIDHLAGTASKPQIGHLLGAAGAAELALTCLAIRDRFVPPTINREEPDPDCPLDVTPNQGRPLAIRAALKLSLGFGGHLAACLVRRVEPGREASDHE